MDSEKQSNEHGLGLDLLSSKQASNINPFLRYEKSDHSTQHPAHHIKYDSSEKSTKRKPGRTTAKAVGGLGLKHLESSWENAESRLRSHKSIASPITQRKKSTKRTRPGRKASTPRIQVHTNIQVQQTSAPLQVFPTHHNNSVSHINGQETKDVEYWEDEHSNSQNRT